jgi:cytochrome bd-type quinol oxidase subunit 2
MIQRIQSLWLIIVALCAFATYTLTLYVGKLADGTERRFLLADDFLLVIIIIALGILALICLFLYKNRKLQFKLSITGMLFSIGFLFLEYIKVEGFKKDNLIQTGSYQIGALLPIVMVIFFFLAARGIYRDERLVKSMDRLR